MICRKCHQDLDESKFSAKKQGGRLKTWCNDCCIRIADISRAAAKEMRRNSGRSYAGRNEFLNAIGFDSYKAYLASDLWKSIRKKVYELKGNFCHLCGNQATELHHNRYHKNDLLGKKLKFINPVCRSCHERIEFGDDGSKATVMEASQAFKRGRKRLKRESRTVPN